MSVFAANRWPVSRPLRFARRLRGRSPRSLASLDRSKVSGLGWVETIGLSILCSLVGVADRFVEADETIGRFTCPYLTPAVPDGPRGFFYCHAGHGEFYKPVLF